MHWTMENTSPCSEMLQSHLYLTHDDPQEANVATLSSEGITDKPEVPGDSNKEFSPVQPEMSTASQTADEETSITSVQIQQLQTSDALSTSSTEIVTIYSSVHH